MICSSLNNIKSVEHILLQKTQSLYQRTDYLFW